MNGFTETPAKPVNVAGSSEPDLLHREDFKHPSRAQQAADIAADLQSEARRAKYHSLLIATNYHE